MSTDLDLLVIGGGSGGLATAQRAAEYGARVAVVESGRLGGTCVNVGCVPKKLMWNAAHLGHALQDAREYGFDLTVHGHDWAQLKSRRDAFVLRLNGVYERNLAARNVTLLRGHARLVEPTTVEVDGRRIRARYAVAATGGEPMLPAIPGAQLGLTSDGFFELPARPQRVALVGSGYIAVELAGVFAALGSSTTLVVRGDGVLRSFDAMLREGALEALRAHGIEVVTKAVPAGLARSADGALALALADERSLGPFDCVIWAIGRRPRTADLDAQRLGLRLDETGFVWTNALQETNLPGLHAIGDVTGRYALTPVAIAAGRRLADRLFGGHRDRCLDYDHVATVIFGHPPIGTVGLTEKEARLRHGDAVEVFSSTFVPMYYGVFDVPPERKPRTRMKLVTHGRERRIVGLHVVGPGADEMLQGFAVAIRMGATKRDFDDTVAIHPTVAEEMVTMREAVVACTS